MPITPKDMLPIVSWSTIANNVKKLTDWAYEVTVHPINYSEPGAFTATVAVNNYLVSYTGRLYSITNVAGEVITVNDDFETGLPPWTGYPAIVFRSICEGESLWLPPINFKILDRSAESYLLTIIQEVLYRSKGDVGKLVYPTDFATASVSYDFKNYYKVVPIGRSKLKVFRQNWDEMGDGALRDKDVPFQDLVVDTEHFQLTIDQYEDLTGVIIEFDFKQAL